MKMILGALSILLLSVGCKPTSESSLHTAGSRKLISHDVQIFLSIDSVKVGTMKDAFDSSLELFAKMQICENKACQDIEFSEGYYSDFKGAYSGEVTNRYSTKYLITSAGQDITVPFLFRSTGTLINRAAEKLKMKNSKDAKIKIQFFEADTARSELIAEKEMDFASFLAGTTETFTNVDYDVSMQLNVRTELETFEFEYSSIYKK